MSERLANKIAAGEVVESPASVVKELVENSIDAGSEKIKIDLIDAGIKEIKVLDDGEGMNKSDALLAFERHATSKLIKEDDLGFIDTLGFRGEALPSIASVSEITLLTGKGDIGTKVVIKAGSIIENSSSDARRGTSITVSNLFFNTPARLKYLKSDATELANSVSLIEKLALSYPAISFTLTNNDKEIITTTGSGNLLKTIHEIYGLAVSQKMISINGENEDFIVNGFICKPEILKSNRNHLITIVNGRIVRNNDLNRFINEAYYTYKPEKKYPIVIINITTDTTLIDVNIHPRKQDIKISKIKSLEELIVKSIKNVLYKTLLIPNANINNSVDYEIEYEANKEEVSIAEEQVTFDFGREELEENTTINSDMKALVLYPIGVVHGTYIICENEEGMFLVDQHAAEERINYEKYLSALKNKEINTIGTLIPITIEMNSSEALVIKEHLDILTNIGFSLEEFGLNTYVVKEHPTWLLTGYEEESIRKILDLLIISKNDFDIVKFNENIAITLACKMSIKANSRISDEDMEEIITALVKCDNPYNCPHGRPTIVKFTTYELEKLFKRVA